MCRRSEVLFKSGNVRKTQISVLKNLLRTDRASEVIHLIPRRLQYNAWLKKRTSEMRQDTILLCNLQIK